MFLQTQNVQDSLHTTAQSSSEAVTKRGGPQRLKCYDALIRLNSGINTAGLFYSDSALQSHVDTFLTCSEFGGNKMYTVGDF